MRKRITKNSKIWEIIRICARHSVCTNCPLSKEGGQCTFRALPPCDWDKHLPTEAEEPCKYCHDEFCCNSDSPYCADYCPVTQDDSICKYKETEAADKTE